MLRFLIAEDEDVTAFLIQCELNKLSRSSAIQRVRSFEEVLAHLAHSEVDILILGRKCSPSWLERGPNTSAQVIAIVEEGDEAAGQALLRRGVRNCYYPSQLETFGDGIERLLEGTPFTPAFLAPPPSPTRGGKIKNRVGDGFAFAKNIPARAQRSWPLVKGKWNELCRISGQKTARFAGSLKSMLGRIEWKKEALEFGRGVIEDFQTFGRWSARTSGKIRDQFVLRMGRFHALKALGGGASLALGIIGRGGPSLSPAASPPMAGMVSPKFEDRKREMPSPNVGAEPQDGNLIRKLFQVSIDPMFLLDRNFSIVDCNAAARACLGADSVMGTKIIKFVDGSWRQSFADDLQMGIRNGPRFGELEVVTSSGGQRHIRFAFHPDFSAAHHLLVWRDETDLLRGRAA